MPAAISKRHRLAYFSIPKSASTSMKIVLYGLKHGTPWTGEPDAVHPLFPTYPIKDEDFVATEDMWRFTIIRDPVSRLLSSYGNRVHHHHDIKKDVSRLPGPSAVLFAQSGLSLYPKPKDFFDNLERYQKFSYSIWHHTTSLRTFLGGDLSRLDAIYRIEDLPDLEAELSRRTGQEIKLPRMQTEGEKITLDMLPARTQSKILAYTREDYCLLNRVLK